MLLGKEPLGKLMSTMHGELCLGESFLTETSTHSIYVPSHETFFFFFFTITLRFLLLSNNHIYRHNVLCILMLVLYHSLDQNSFRVAV